jgi:hypothetical protein
MNYRPCDRGLSRLEPCAVKVASTVLRGLGGGNAAWLPDPATGGPGFTVKVHSQAILA